MSWCALVCYASRSATDEKEEDEEDEEEEEEEEAEAAEAEARAAGLRGAMDGEFVEDMV